MTARDDITTALAQHDLDDAMVVAELRDAQQRVTQLVDQAVVDGARISDLVAQAVIDEQTITRQNAVIADLRTQLRSTLVGYSVSTDGRESKAQALARQTANLGAPQVIRHFYAYGSLTFPPADGAYGETPLVLSFKRSPIDVVAGKHDAELSALLDALPTDRVTWLAAFDHENDKKVYTDKKYTAAESKAAWEHVARLIKAHPNDQVQSILIVTGYDILQRLPALLPDDLGLLDVLAVDPYAGGPTRDVARQMRPMLDAAAALGKPLAIAETQNNQGTDEERAAYYQAQLELAYAQGYPFVCFFPGENVPAFTRDAFPKATATWQAATA